jgi:hypothetical protein
LEASYHFGNKLSLWKQAFNLEAISVWKQAVTLETSCNFERKLSHRKQAATAVTMDESCHLINKVH